MPFERDPNELGALWEKSGPKGPYFTGTISGVKVVVFKNTKKNSEKSPDWRVLKSQPKLGDDTPKREMHNANAKPRSDDDIEF